MLQKTQKIIWPKSLQEADVKHFVDQGFYIANELLSHEEIEELKNDAPKIIREEYSPAKHPVEILPTDSDEDVIQKVLCIHQPHFHSPLVNKYVKHPKICSILSQLSGAHLPFWDGSVKCMQSMFFVKPPAYQGQAWHQDEFYIPTRDRSLIGAWIALDDAFIDNGCLWILPGSHRDGQIYPQKAHHNNEEYDAMNMAYGFDDSKQIAVEVKKGSVVFFNGYLLHRSQKNRSDQYRRVLVSHYMNSYSILPWGESALPASLQDNRSIELVSGIDPYEWKGVTKEEKIHFRRHS